MKKIATMLLLLLGVCRTAEAQSIGNCQYQPALDQPMHRPDTVLVTFSDYASVRLSDPELGYVFVYRTSLEQQNGANTMSSCQYLATRNNIKTSGNQLCITPHEYNAPSAQSNRLPQRKGWGTGQDDAFRFAIPAGTLTAVDQAGVEHVLDSISFQYLYTEVEDTNIVEHDPFEYRLTPASGEQVTSLGEFILEFPYCPGIFTMNYEQPQNPYVLDADGQVVVTGKRTMVMDIDHAGRITLQHRVITPGQYTLVVPAGSYHMSTSEEAWDDSICHPEIRAIYDVLGEESMAWQAVPADGETVKTFDGIYLSFPGKTIASRATNLGGGNLKVYKKDDDKYSAMEFSYYFSKIIDNRLCFTTASQVSKIKDGTTYYYDVPYGLVTFDDGTVSDAFHVEFTYNTQAEEIVPLPTVADNYVGYTTGAVYRKNGVRFNSGSEQGMLIRLPLEKTAQLAGRKINAIRTATGTSQMDDPRLVIIEGDDINASPAVEQATTKFSTSMKDYALDTPYEIKGDKPLFVGIKCSLSAAYNPMLFDETLDLPAGYAWALTSDGWTDISRMGYGAPNIQLLVDQNVAVCDLLVKPFHTGAYNKMGEPLTISTQVFNYGVNEVNDFDVIYKIGNAASVSKHISGINLKQGETYDLVINDVDVPAAGLLSLDVEVNNVNATEDADKTDNAQFSQPYIYPADVRKKILFEEFTGMGCINCPAAAITVNEVLSQLPGEYVEVYHHAGYNPDNFTLDEDLEYTWFYNNGGSTFAPGGMVNRTAASAEATSVVFQSNEIASVRNAVDAALQVAPYVAINMYNAYDNALRSGHVSIDVHCFEVPSSQPHVLNVWLVQDSVVRYQKGSGVVAHNNAMRMSLTGYWGKQILLEAGADNTYEFDYTIPASIASAYAANVFGPTSEVDDKDIVAIPSNMRLVAFVSDLTESPLTCHVWNVEQCPVTEIIDQWQDTGVQAPAASSSSRMYDLQGRPVSQPRHGLYIMNGKKVIR